MTESGLLPSCSSDWRSLPQAADGPGGGGKARVLQDVVAPSVATAESTWVCHRWCPWTGGRGSSLAAAVLPRGRPGGRGWPTAAGCAAFSLASHRPVPLNPAEFSPSASRKKTRERKAPDEDRRPWARWLRCSCRWASIGGWWRPARARPHHQQCPRGGQL